MLHKIPLFNLCIIRLKWPNKGPRKLLRLQHTVYRWSDDWTCIIWEWSSALRSGKPGCEVSSHDCISQFIMKTVPENAAIQLLIQYISGWSDGVWPSDMSPKKSYKKKVCLLPCSSKIDDYPNQPSDLTKIENTNNNVSIYNVTILPASQQVFLPPLHKIPWKYLRYFWSVSQDASFLFFSLIWNVWQLQRIR